jgi:hypothetical protein
VIDPLLDEESGIGVCHHCNSGQVAELYGIGGRVVGVACGSCIMAFEEDDAPEELAITLGEADLAGMQPKNDYSPPYTEYDFR